MVIAEGTRKLLGNLFDLEDLGAQDLKGIVEPVRAWAAVRPASFEGRFEAFHASGLTDLVGREEELELLLRRWSKAKTGEGQVVLLSGEAGIGKSRLTAALLERLAGEPHTRLRYFCSPQHTDSAFYPIISQMERAAGLAHGDSPQAKLDKLDALLAQTSTSKQDAALLAELLSLPNDDRYAPLDLPSQQRRQKTLAALDSQLEALARQSPVLMICEDAHWSDPTSLEAFGRAVDRIRTLRVLLIVTFRPEFEPPWIGRPHVAALTLNRLTQSEIGAVIDGVVGNKLIPANIRQDIIERTDGIPLFVEEMTKAVLEAGNEAAAHAMARAIPSSALAVPASLHASLMARLDRLGPAKEVAQIGAAIGREFSHALLAAVVSKPRAELTAALDRLMAAGLLFRQGVPPHATYLFKHALVQDASYGTLLREPRRALHARIAEAIESQFPEIAESQPELLARHCTESGLIEKAAGLWGKAGRRSLARSAYAEGAEQLRHALAQIATLPITPALRREQIKLQVAFINPSYHVAGFAAPETKAAVERARLLIEQAEALGEPPEDPLLLFTVLYSLWGSSYVAFNGDVICELAAQFMTLAERQRATVPLMIGHRLKGMSLLSTGEIAEGRAHLDSALALYAPAEHRPLAMRFGQDVRVAIYVYRSMALWMLGRPEAALKDVGHAVADAREIGQAATLMYALNVALLSLDLCRDYRTESALADELISLASEKGALFWKACGLLHRGGVLAGTGNASEAVQTITSGLAAFRSTGATVNVPITLLNLAKAHAQLGKFDEALGCISEATAAVERTRKGGLRQRFIGMAGEIALQSGRRASRELLRSKSVSLRGVRRRWNSYSPNW